MKIYPLRVYLSAYMTSLNAPGFSISLLNVSAVQQILHAHTTPETAYVTPTNIIDLLDDSTDALAWIGVRSNWPAKGQDRLTRLAPSSPEQTLLSNRPDNISTWNLTDITANTVKSGIKSACEAVLSVEGELTEYDTVLGDGDCGKTFSAGAKGRFFVLAAEH
jgi:dihydroxyacetone kinase